MTGGLRGHRAGLLLTLVGAVMVVVGAARGEARIVLMKAIRVCLECVGIG
ncbi:MAG: thioredoxin [Oscillospiraceae bacterium]|jgi:hypothetical protein|nr:thioredoxin [Oscillospiraceae bacterium]